MDCSGLSDDDYHYMLNFLRQEGNGALVDYMAREGIDPRKTPVEFMRYEMKSLGGVYYNEKGETTLPGLYAAGDEIFGGISNAAIYGWISGENAVSYSKTVEFCDLKKQEKSIKHIHDLAGELRNRETGGDWKEFNFALQETMDDYCGYVRSATLLEAGLKHLQRVKQKAYSAMVARDQWQLTRCLEVLNLLDLSEITILAANERKETRGRHFRADHPFANVALDKMLLYVKQKNGKPVTEWRKLKD